MAENSYYWLTGVLGLLVYKIQKNIGYNTYKNALSFGAE